MLVGGLVVAVVYFIAADLVFPDESDTPEPLDSHFWANKRTTLCLLIVANLLGVCSQFAVNLTRDNGMILAITYAVNFAIYLALVGIAAWTKRRWLFAVTIGLHTALYLGIAIYSVVAPPPPDTPLGKANAEAVQ